MLCVQIKTYVSVTFLLFVLFALCLTLNEKGEKKQKHQNNSKKKTKLKYIVNYFFCRKWRKNCFKKKKKQKEIMLKKEKKRYTGEKKIEKKNENKINNFALCDRDKKLFIPFLFFLKYF